MKTMKKIISLTMAVVMLITASPVLQAVEFADLNRAQMGELQKEILQDVKVNVPNPIGALKALHDKATENSKARLAEFNDKIQGEALEAVKEHLNGLKEQAKELAKSESYSSIPQQERKQVALNTIMFEDIKEAFQDLEFMRNYTLWTSAGLMATGAIIKLIHWTRWGFAHFTYLHPGATPGYFKSLAAGESFLCAGVILFIASIIIELFTDSYTPTIAPSLNAEETSRIFSEKPFTFLETFENEAEYANLYKKCPELLNDAVTIEYYTSLASVTAEDIKDMSYIQTLGWYKMTTEERTAYLHDFAERLRAESKAKTSKYSKKVGLVEA